MMCAIAIAIGNSYYQRGTARLAAMPPGEIDRLFPVAKVVEDKGRFRVTLRSRFVPIAEVAQRIGLDQLIANGDSLDRHQITFESYEQATLEELIAKWPIGDTRTADENRCAISGHVTNQDDRPAAGADITLLHASKPVGDGVVRRDGTFTISFDFQASSDYSLRITWAGSSQSHQMQTRTFAMAPGIQERLVRVRIRQ